MSVHDETRKKMMPVQAVNTDQGRQDLEYDVVSLQLVRTVSPVGVERPLRMAVKAVAFHGFVYRVRSLCRSP